MTSPPPAVTAAPLVQVPLPGALRAAAPGRRHHADVVVVGSGVAGLAAALRLRRHGLRVAVVTKGEVSSGSTRWAQGGIAAALAPTDSPDAHFADTLAAGGGLCDPAAVRVLVDDGPERVRSLLRLGARFDLDAAGTLALTREGGHGTDRVAHAGGDATGEEISRALVEALARLTDDPAVQVYEHAFAIDVLTDATGAACGVLVDRGGRTAQVCAPAVVLATGGIGQVYRSTTNPPEATGDGVAMALRAGALLADLEFVQFHPTVLWRGAGASGQQPLISEALRGEGAVLLDVTGKRFMPEVDPRAELAPRDVVSRAIVDRLAATGADHVLLDARRLGPVALPQRFPTIVRRLREHGVDPVTALVPVAPAQHYHSGGVRTDLVGRSTVPGLYAVGECACTGVHGANRLASNSLLEGLVFAARLADDVAARLAVGEFAPGPAVPRPVGALQRVAARPAVQRAATTGPGVLRDPAGLALAARELAELLPVPQRGEPAAQERGGPVGGVGSATLGRSDELGGPAERAELNPAAWEVANLHTVALALTAAAAARPESRGGHVRRDRPASDPRWVRRVTVRRTAEGVLALGTQPATESLAPRATPAEVDVERDGVR